MKRSTRLGAIGLLLVLAGCSGAAPSAAPASTSPAAAPSTSVTPGSSSSVPPPSVQPSGPGATPEPAIPWVAYEWGSNSRAGDGLWLMHPDGSDAHEVDPAIPGQLLHPDWSPNGTEIAVEVVDDTSVAIWTLRPDGSGLRKVIAP